eukprot:SAG31_NODE_110_length_24476_cov_9.909654_10_plen_50_part_00
MAGDGHVRKDPEGRSRANGVQEPANTSRYAHSIDCDIFGSKLTSSLGCC